eukprot:2413045-Rhodomonas_salina.1
MSFDDGLRSGFMSVANRKPPARGRTVCKMREKETSCKGGCSSEESRKREIDFETRRARTAPYELDSLHRLAVSAAKLDPVLKTSNSPAGRLERAPWIGVGGVACPVAIRLFLRCDLLARCCHVVQLVPEPFRFVSVQ